MKLEGPQEILQLIIQEQADDFMEEEITDFDDYANQIQWVSDAKQGKHVISTTTKQEDAPMLLQLQQMNGDIFPNKSTAPVPVPDDCKTDSRWEEINQKIRID